MENIIQEENNWDVENIIQEENKWDVENLIKSANENISKDTNNGQMPTWWSWAWSFATFITLIWIKRVWLSILYIILYIIPFINFAFFIFSIVYWWLKGKEIIYNSPKYLSHDEKMWAIKTLETIWFFTFIIFMIILSIVAIPFILWITIFSSQFF